MTSRNLSGAGTRLMNRLGRLQWRCVLATTAAASLIAAALAALGLAICAILFCSGWLLVLLVAPMVWLALHWRHDFTRHGIAVQLESKAVQVRGRLLPALELLNYRFPGLEGYSPELTQAAIKQAEQIVLELPPSILSRRRRLVTSALFFLFGTGTLAGLWFWNPLRTGIGIVNAFRPASVPITFAVQPGDTAVLPGQQITLRCRVTPAGLFRNVGLTLTDIQPGKGRNSATASRETRRLPLSHDTCRMPLSLRSDLNYQFHLLGRSSPVFKLRLIEPLTLEMLSSVLFPPPYTGLESTRLSGTEIPALIGTRVRLEGTANRPLSEGWLVFERDTFPVTVTAEDPHCFSAEFTVTGNSEGRIEIRETGPLQHVSDLRIRAISDESPFVKIFLPGRDIDLPRQMQVLLGINSLDDYGLGALFLLWGRDSLENRTRLAGLGNRREDTTLYVWDLSESGLLPGDRLVYCVEVSDNDVVSGPKFSRSEVFSVRFPTMAEIFDAAVNQTENTAARLSSLPAQQTTIGNELSRISDELKKNRTLSWEERRRLERILQEQEELTARVAELAREVAETAQELTQGFNFDPATLAQLSELQSLLQRLLPPELTQALQELRERLQQDARQLQPALDELRTNQEKLKQGIEQALQLLRRLLQEQRLEALARKADELVHAQEQLTADISRQLENRLARQQAEVSNALDSLHQEIAELAREFKEGGDSAGSDSDIGDSLASLSQQLEQNRTGAIADELIRRLNAGDQQSSSQLSRQLAEHLRQTAASLQRLSQQLKDRRRSQLGQQLAASAFDLLALSEQQEKLEQTSGNIGDPASLANQQQALLDGTRIAAESLAALAGKTMAIPPEIGQMFGRTMEAMRKAAGMLSQNQATAARNEMRKAREGLNSAAAALLNTLEQSQQGGMTGGLESLLESLRQLAAQQLAVNAGMSGIPIPIPMPAGLTQQQLQQLRSLLEQQQAIREQLQQLLQNMGGDRPGLTATLDRLLEEMRSVERDLAELNVTRQLIERQEGIAARLLDAERSIRQQGFREERQSETGRPFELTGRPQLPADRGERNRMLREELMRALKSNYPPEYERMIRAYFERLLNAP
ncbi:MAG: DUF4175 family protein [candidate division WOR-3 bacterium]